MFGKAFEEREFDSSPDGLVVHTKNVYKEYAVNCFRSQASGPNRQEVVNILLALMVSTPGSRVVSYSCCG